MKHAGPKTLHVLQPLLEQIRGCKGLTEKKPGIFYRGSAAFLHFHEDPVGLFADVKITGKDFQRFAVDTKLEQNALLAAVHTVIDMPQRHNQAEFLERGIQSLSIANTTGDYVDAAAVLNKLQQRLDAAKMKVASHHGQTAKKTPLKPTALKHLRASDAAAIAKLATEATLGVTRMAEGVHQAVWRTLGVKGGQEEAQTGGLTGLIYKTVRGVTQGVGKGIDLALTRLQPLFDAADQAAPETPEREAVLAALNGVLGDHLAATQNPLATVMTLRYQGRALDLKAMPRADEVTGKVLLMIHGLCMNDLQWSSAQTEDDQPHDHGQILAKSLGYTPLYLRYNTGLHTSQNGRQLSRQLEVLVKQWPQAISELSAVVHSMGGLVIRSALVAAEEESLTWPQHLKNIVFLGTPHQGAPLERAGNWVDVILGSTPYSRPFAKLGQLRSAGITDLRYGHVVDADWHGHDRFRKKPDSRQVLLLPEQVACFTVAATLAGKQSLVAERLIGDGLVPLPSALGQHAQAHRTLKFAKASQRIVYRTGHMALLSSPEVTQQLLTWLQAPSK